MSTRGLVCLLSALLGGACARGASDGNDGSPSPFDPDGPAEPPDGGDSGGKMDDPEPIADGGAPDCNVGERDCACTPTEQCKLGLQCAQSTCRSCDAGCDYCGNGSCGPDEDCDVCPADCAPCDTCGDGHCEPPPDCDDPDDPESACD